jgi:hypothetical protein
MIEQKEFWNFAASKIVTTKNEPPCTPTLPPGLVARMLKALRDPEPIPFNAEKYVAVWSAKNQIAEVLESRTGRIVSLFFDTKKAIAHADRLTREAKL